MELEERASSFVRRRDLYNERNRGSWSDHQEELQTSDFQVGLKLRRQVKVKDEALLSTDLGPD